jgi:hypothetical protein
MKYNFEVATAQMKQDNNNYKLAKKSRMHENKQQRI